jgi:hypothetical protein
MLFSIKRANIQMIGNGNKNSFYRLLTLSLIFSSLSPISNSYADDSGDELGQNIHSRKQFSMSGDVKGEMVYSDLDSDTKYLTRLRLQLDTGLTPDVHIVGRINVAKLYNSEVSDDDEFFVDRFYFSWSDIGKTPFSFSGGRLPTMGETSPSHLRLGLDQPNGTFSPFTDIALDGVVGGYGKEGDLPGKFELYYASQFDVGYEGDKNNYGLTDTDIYGFKWDLLKNGTRSVTLQSLLIADIRNLPKNVNFVNPLEFALWQNNPSRFDTSSQSLVLDRVILGDIYETSFTYLDTFQGLTLFVNLGWSHTNPEAIDELGTGLLSSFWNDPKSEDGYCLYAGLRYDLNEVHSKVGLEFNYGSKYWIGFSQNAETAKLATRGSVLEVYWIFNPSLPAALSKWTKSIIGRVGYQYYDYQYTGSGFWLGEPLDEDTLNNDPINARFYSPLDSEHKIYAAVEVFF